VEPELHLQRADHDVGGLRRRGSGRFYESVGALRDVVQNHLLQVVALLAMEPPAGADADALRDERGKLFRQIRTVEPATWCAASTAATGRSRRRAGVRRGDVRRPPLEIDSWRWAGVPWLIRTGKHLPVTATEASSSSTRRRASCSRRRARRPAPEPPALPAGRNDGVMLHLQTKAPATT
jgi:glucose-6-phosphate 1-dehydrogenase